MFFKKKYLRFIKMANVIIIRPISESWSGELYKRALSIPHGPLTLSAHLINKGYDPLIIDEIALSIPINGSNVFGDNLHSNFSPFFALFIICGA